MRDADYYEILGLCPETEGDEIRQAYQRALAKPGNDAERTRLIKQAYAVLRDPVARAEYDARCVGYDLIDETVAAITKVGPPVVDEIETREHELLETLRRRQRPPSETEKS